MTTEPSDALTVARWCWGDRPWHMHTSESVWPCWHQDQESAVFCGDYGADVAAAERILIERGHGEAYGTALIREIAPPWPIRGPTVSFAYLGEAACAFATAPLAVRLRAMAEVIRHLQPKETP